MKIVAKEGVSVRITVEPGKYVFVTGVPVEIDERNENVMSQVRWLLDSGLVMVVHEQPQQPQPVIQEGLKGEGTVRRRGRRKE